MCKVTSAVDTDYQGKKRESVRDVTRLWKGRRRWWRGCRSMAITRSSKDAVLNVMGSSPGQPYSAAAVASDRNNILAMYYNDGFPEARFDEAGCAGQTRRTGCG